MKKSRIFNIMQYERHPETNIELLSEEQIKSCVSHKSIKRWAYICHDEDVYSLADEENNPAHVQGEKKPRHWHIVLEMGTRQVEVGVIAKWLGITDNFVDCAKGHGAFLDCVQYLTHEGDKQQDLGKRLYSDECVVANFDFRLELNKRSENKMKYGKDLNPKDQMRFDVFYLGKTLRECEQQDKLLYIEDWKELKRMRLDFIGRQSPPKNRVNYYVQGRGGVGKGLMCRALARSLFPQYENDEDIFFEVGAEGASFEGYDGQPVLIWNDRRAIDLLHELKGRGNVFNIFDTHPTKQKQNIKYGSVNLCNLVNIVNSVQPYSEFLDGLAGAYEDSQGNVYEVEDKGQSYRRFPFIIPIHEDDFDLYLNKGFMENTSNFEEYIQYNGIRGNMQRIAEACGNNEKLARQIEMKTMGFVTDKHREVISKMEHDVTDEEEILKQFEDFGTMPEQMEIGEFIEIVEDDNNSELPFG